MKIKSERTAQFKVMNCIYSVDERFGTMHVSITGVDCSRMY